MSGSINNCWIVLIWRVFWFGKKRMVNTILVYTTVAYTLVVNVCVIEGKNSKIVDGALLKILIICCRRNELFVEGK